MTFGDVLSIGWYSMAALTLTQGLPLDGRPAGGEPAVVAAASAEVSAALVSPDTLDAFSKPNHSPVWEHDGFVWAALLNRTDNRTYIWNRADDGTWSRTSIEVHNRLSDRTDCVADSAENRVYIFASHDSYCRVTACQYTHAGGPAGGTWAVDPAVKMVAIPGIADAERTSFAVTTRWSTTYLFAFAYSSNRLLVNWSADLGHTWQSAPTEIANGSRIGSNTTTGLLYTGLPDSTEFSAEGVNYVGLFFGEEDRLNGFLRLQEGVDPGRPDNWIFESVPKWTVGTAPRADDHVSLVRDASETDNALYAGCKSGEGEVNYGIFSRTPAGVWSLAETTMTGRRPSAQYDANSGTGFLIATNTSTGPVTFRTFNPNDLTFSSEQMLIQSGTQNFRNGGGSHLPWTGRVLDFMAGNQTTNRAWEGVIQLSQTPAPRTIELNLDVVDGQVIDLTSVDGQDLTGFRIIGLSLRDPETNIESCTVGPEGANGFPVAEATDPVEARVGGSATIDYGPSGDVVSATQKDLLVLGNGLLRLIFYGPVTAPAP